MEAVGAGDLLSMMMSFIVVIGLLLLTLLGIKKYGSGMALSNDRRIQILEVKNIGARQKLLLVEVDGEQILIGATANNMNKLAQWSVDPEAGLHQDPKL